jgi:hypothetical protein
MDNTLGSINLPALAATSTAADAAAGGSADAGADTDAGADADGRQDLSAASLKTFMENWVKERPSFDGVKLSSIRF